MALSIEVLGFGWPPARLLRQLAAGAGAGLMLGACALVDQQLLPLLSGEDPAPAALEASAPPTSAAPAADPVGGRTAEALAIGGPALLGQLPPLVLIRFERPDVAYETALRAAVTSALARRPGARFDLLAVAPAGQGGALSSDDLQRDVAAVLRAMTAMGVSEDRLTLSATTSANVAVREVHVYVR